MPGLNLIFSSNDIVASPTDDAETVVGLLVGPTTIFDNQPVYLYAWCDVSPGADTSLIGIQIRQTSLTGDVVGTGGAVGPALDGAGAPIETQLQLHVTDAPGNAQNATYVVTLICADASAAATVNGVYLEARVG